MAITNYTELLAAVSDWMDRDMTGKAPECVSLAEARLNRELGFVASTAVLSTVEGSNSISLSGITYSKPVSLYVTVNGEERFIQPVALGTVAETEIPGVPSSWAPQTGSLRFDCPANAAYPARFTYEGKIQLSESVETNEILSDYPDLYLSASIVWGNVYVRNAEQAAIFKGMLEESLQEAKRNLAQRKRGTLFVDPMFARPGRYDPERDVWQ